MTFDTNYFTVHVVSANELNRVLDDLMVVPLSGTQYLITGNEMVTIGIRVDSVVRCESIFTVNQSMVLRRLGVLNDWTIRSN